MKHIFGIVLLIILIKPVFPVVEYAVNYDYISKVLCINKDQPKLKCNGKCYLMRQLAKNASDTEKKSDKETTSKVEFQLLYLEEITSLALTPLFLLQKHQINKEFLQLYEDAFTSTLLDPPRFA
ncbi:MULTISPECIES: hypothetical protein [Mesonia]|nr:MULTISPECIES: hypothetical protein [Mesonia]MAN28331.1 hypothetical protein [Mesonia sp.]